MASKTEIANLAISHLGIGKDIGNIDTEASEEARVCRRFYDVALQSTLEDVEWPFAKVRVTLGLVETFTASTDEWAYSYRYPSNCVKARRIFSGTRNDSRQTRAAYKITQDSQGRLIYTDIEDAILEYTKFEDDPSYYPASFQLAFSYRLAMYTVPRLAKGDPFGMREWLSQMYEYEITRAASNSFNEQQDEERPVSEFERVRE